MPKIEVIAGGYALELEVPTDHQVMDSLRYQLMLTLTNHKFQALALQPDGENQLTAVAALQVAITTAMVDALPQIITTPGITVGPE